MTLQHRGTASRVIALLGAESTGKTELAQAMVSALRDQGHACSLVSEYLREWCDQKGRVPQPDEQLAIAHVQMRRIDEAAATPNRIVVADTTALMTAIYSDLLFGDTSLYREALARQGGYAVTLVTALDLPWVADGLQRDGPQVREPVDTLLRAALTRGAITYSVVHGSGTRRLLNAMTAIRLPGPASVSATATATSATPFPASKPNAERRASACDRCADADCEQRLFSDLLRQRR